MRPMAHSSLPSPRNKRSFLLWSLQEVFPVQYGTKFDTALQALIAGLVCKLEQLFPVPNLSQVCACAHVHSGFLFVSSESVSMLAPPNKMKQIQWGFDGEFS